jgi:hypothetical protein
MKKATIAFLTAASVFSGGAGYAWDTWGQITFYLQEDMTEQQVMNLIGSWPNKVEQTTCGNDTREGGWSCRILAYGNSYGGLRIYLEWRDGRWRVNSWSAYP